MARTSGVIDIAPERGLTITDMMAFCSLQILVGHSLGVRKGARIDQHLALQRHLIYMSKVI